VNTKTPRLQLLTILVIASVSLLAGCEQGPQSCPKYTTVELVTPESYPSDDQLPFQFPLENPESYTQPIMTNFAVCGQDTERCRECHAAEDYLDPPGTPIYAFADGDISFSGPMGGYGWLIIIDHPQANLYSLYGHLSPSRWQAEPGPVEKGELIGYLGDPDENGGSPEQPLIPHLHFGIRAGQRTDYPGTGEWRWMAGWIAICPQDSGWLQPAVVISNQHIPEGGFPMPAGAFLAIWWFPLLFGGIYVFGWVCILIYATKKQKPHFLISIGALYIVAAWVFFAKHSRLSYILIALAVVSIGLGIYRVIKRANELKN
jgi:hypothetical protein